jgi:hypothetical protein
MRSYIDLAENVLFESVDFHPAVLEDHDGEIYIVYPPGSEVKSEQECHYCNGSGKDVQNDAYREEFGKDLACDGCAGTGRVTETDYIFPNMNVSSANAFHIARMIGLDPDHTGWVPPEEIPNLIRTLMRLKNTDTTRHEVPSEDTGGDRYVDTSGQVPRIGTTMRMIGGGIDSQRIESYVNRLMEICKWAQDHHCGVSWG